MKEPKPILILVGLTILLIFILYFTLNIVQPNNDCNITGPHYHDKELYYNDTTIIKQKHYPSGEILIDTIITINKVDDIPF